MCLENSMIGVCCCLTCYLYYYWPEIEQTQTLNAFTGIMTTQINIVKKILGDFVSIGNVYILSFVSVNMDRYVNNVNEIFWSSVE